jgi:hypothetical protein
MSNYTKTTDFEAKDSLPSGDSGKIIRGSEFETEFDNIATAIASKSDANNPTFTGTVTIDGLTVNGNTVLGNAASDTVTVTADIASNLLPSADDTYNLGAVGAEWNDLFIDGTANIDSLVADTADINGGTIDGVTIGGSSAGAITGTTITGTSFASTGDMTFGDNDKALFGAGSDLQIFHDGSNSYITDTGTGDLQIKGTQLSLKGANNESFLYAVENGPVRLYYDNAEKLITTATGVDVTGTVTADGLTVYKSGSGDAEVVIRPSDSSGDPVLKLKENSASTRLTIRSDESDGAKVKFQTGNTEVTRLAFGQSGDISFYEDTGTTAKLFWDASAESLGIGTTSPSSTLHLFAANPTITFQEGAGSTSISGDVANLEYTVPSGKSHIFSGGNVGIGTSSPSSALEVSEGGGGNTVARFTNSAQANSFIQFNDTASTVRPRIGSAGNNLILDTANTERMRIDSDGNVGIGTDSPATKLEVANTSAGVDLSLRSSTTGTASLYFGDSASIIQGRVAYDNSSNSMAFTTAASERMRIDSDGNVGIGTDSPTRLLHVRDTSSQTVAVFDGGSNSAGEIGFRSNGTSGDTYVTIGAVANDMVLSAGASERVRITSSGHLLVGKTSQDSTNTVGFEAKDDGIAVATTDGSQSLILNRKTSDGVIADFRKDNSSVGSIGTHNGQMVIGSADTGLGFQGDSTGTVDDAILPVDISTSARRDAAISLGHANGRFKDLYLSGGAYLGGTAAANKLDDYEEGTWTPVYEPETGSFTTMTMDNVSNTYTKIGDTVIAMCHVRTSDVDVTGASGDLRLGGLPFTISGYFEVSIGNVLGWTGERPDGGYGFTGQDYIKLRYRSSVTSDSADSSVTDLTTGTTANKNQIILTFIYKTTA